MDIEESYQRRRGKWRDYQRFEEKDEDEMDIEPNGINPFCMVFFVAILSISLALFITFSIKSNTKGDEIEFNLYTLQRKESSFGN